MSIEPFRTAIIEVAKQSIKDIGKGISEGLKEGADKISEVIKEKYLQNETLPVNEISENIPSELKEISTEVVEVEQIIDYQAEEIVKNPEQIKVTIETIENKIDTFLDGFLNNIEGGASFGEHSDHIITNGTDIIKEVNSYITELKDRLKDAGVDVDEILENLHAEQNYIDDELDESDFDESE